MIAIRFTFGAICTSDSTSFVATENSKKLNPVALPPGRARLCTRPSPTGSVTPTNTMGMFFVS